MRLAERRVDRNPAVGRDGRHLGDEAALPEARRCHHAHDGARPRDRPVQYTCQRGQFPLAANQSRVPSADCPVVRPRPAGDGRALAARTPLMLTNFRSSRTTASSTQPRGGLAEHHPARRRRRLHPLRHSDLLAYGRVSACARADFPGDHLAGVQAHPKLQVDAVPILDVERQLLRLYLEIKCGKACAKGMVLQRHRGPENGHDPVAGELVHRSAVALHNDGRILAPVRS